MNDFFSGVDHFAFDLDGTLYLGDEAIPGAVELVTGLRARSRVVYFTNNSGRSAEEVRAKLRHLGFECAPDEVYASSTATAAYLVSAGLDRLFVVGSAGLRAELRRHGLEVVDSAQAEHVVVGYDPDLSYQRVATAMTVLLRGGRFIACNEDPRFPAGGGRWLPGAGAMVGAIHGASGRRPDFIVGKPNTHILELIAARFAVDRERLVVVGDSVDSDIRMAASYGCRAVLVGDDPGELPGDAGRTLVVRDLRQLQERLRGAP